jgi:hypothetical protein
VIWIAIAALKADPRADGVKLAQVLTSGGA